MPSYPIPKRTQVLVIGGGPAGSTVATLLAREGIEVTLIEKEVFPRYHIGESLLPSALEFFDLLGVREKVEAHGFQRKPGAYIEWGNQQWNLYFNELSGARGYSFQVVRSEFDHLLLKHAASQGVAVFEGICVSEIVFNQTNRACGAVLKPADERNSSHWGIKFDYVIDASGRFGSVISRQLNNRRYHDAFKNVALWGYWKGVNSLPGDMGGSIVTASIPNGWIWGIPLHDDTTSIGVVMHKDALKERQSSKSPTDIYLSSIAESALMADLLANGEMTTELSVETDYSYRADRFAGPGYFLAGDAACFLDPLLSTGVHLAMLSGLISAASINSVLRKEISEDEAIEFYERSYRSAYLRLLVFVSSFYKQNSQKDAIFKTAHNLSHNDATDADLKAAFTSLASGIEDMESIKGQNVDIQNLILEEMSQQLHENLEMRKDKEFLINATVADAEKIQKNHEFFGVVEGLPILAPHNAIDGLYIDTNPHLRLAIAG